MFSRKSGDTPDQAGSQNGFRIDAPRVDLAHGRTQFFGHEVWCQVRVEREGRDQINSAFRFGAVPRIGETLHLTPAEDGPMWVCRVTDVVHNPLIQGRTEADRWAYVTVKATWVDDFW